MLNSDSVLSQIFWCFWCSIEFVLKDRIDLRWIGPLHETSIQLNYLGVDFIQTCSNEKNSWNSGFVVLCCCFPWRMDLVFEKSQLLLFFPPSQKKTNYDVTIMSQHVPVAPVKVAKLDSGWVPRIWSWERVNLCYNLMVRWEWKNTTKGGCWYSWYSSGPRGLTSRREGRQQVWCSWCVFFLW